MLDLTKEIPLENKNYSLYRKLQLALYLVAILSAAYFAYLVLFPHKIFNFSFLEPNAIGNNIAAPQINGSMPNMAFSNVVPDYYSHASISLDVPKKIGAAAVFASIRKSYRAFFYEESDPIGFKDGLLLKSDNRYYIVSEGYLRKFDNLDAAAKMGYPTENFWDVSSDELKYNPQGSNISPGENYPDSTLFKIGDAFYILKDKKLAQFSSLNAFNSQYAVGLAIPKENDFFGQFPVSEELVGFSDGSLVSNGDSALIVSARLIYPIDNAQTFLDKGYAWENISPATSAEVSQYDRTRLFNVKDAHPDGTIFKTTEDGKFYLIREGKKHPLPSSRIAASWKNAPVLASQESLETKEYCGLEKNSFWKNSYSCIIPLEKFNIFSGNEYEITLNSETKFPVDYISVDYKRNTDIKNLKLSLFGILNKIKLNYGIQTEN